MEIVRVQRLEPKLDEQLEECDQMALPSAVIKAFMCPPGVCSATAPAISGRASDSIVMTSLRQAVKTVFENTEVDEAADAVSGVITDIVNRLPRFPFLR